MATRTLLRLLGTFCSAKPIIDRPLSVLNCHVFPLGLRTFWWVGLCRPNIVTPSDALHHVEADSLVLHYALLMATTFACR